MRSTLAQRLVSIVWSVFDQTCFNRLVTNFNISMFGHQTMFDGVWSPNISRLSRPLSAVHATERKNWKRRLYLETWSGNSHDSSDVIDFKMLRFQTIFHSHQNVTWAFLISSGLTEELVDGRSYNRNKAASSNFSRVHVGGSQNGMSNSEGGIRYACSQ